MSVYTTVTQEVMQAWLKQYDLGQLVQLEGISAGITNTNYFATTTQGRYVLTLFEALHLEELPYYLQLMSHLAQHGVACPAPIADQQQQFASMLAGKPACLVSCLDGADVDWPNVAQCAATGQMLAKMHQVGAHFPMHMDNPRGPAWWYHTAEQVYAAMDKASAASLREEVRFQQQQDFSHLPAGVIHADLFRDNVLLKGDNIAGFIDFYYACNDVLLYDIAIAVNDWARLPSGELDDELARAFLSGYQSIRPLSAEESAAWPAMLRAGALRFWVSRLLDFHQPMSGELTYTKDPAELQQLLEAHRQRQDFWL